MYYNYRKGSFIIFIDKDISSPILKKIEQILRER